MCTVTDVSIRALVADGNRNNRIDNGDYDLFLAYFGQMAPQCCSIGASSAVLKQQR